MRIDLGRRRPGIGIELVAQTRRLQLVAATLDLLNAELQDPAALGAALGVPVPPSWPPGEYDRNALEFFKGRLKAAGPSAIGWYHWYVLALGDGGSPQSLIAGAGYMGPPAQDGSVEIGYSVLPEARRQGFAAEIVEFLVARALATGDVHKIIAHTLESNLASARLLQRCGFVLVCQSAEGGLIRYERT